MVLYDSSEWKSLDAVERAQLLLVIEGLKRGAIIRGNWNGFLDIVRGAGLEYKLESKPDSAQHIFSVAKKEVFEEVARRESHLENACADDYHRIDGWMLSYPSCCVEAYISKQSRFGHELSDTIKKEGKYPEVFDYLPPPFTPCSLYCKEAITTLTNWKKTLDKNDPQAANELIYFNRIHPPARFAHQKYLQKEEQKRHIKRQQ